MEVRQRRKASQEPASSPTAESEFASAAKSLDLFAKTHDDLSEKTSSGATVSVVSVAVILLLVISEFRAYLTPTVVDHLYVDTTRTERIKINLNITFPSMPCSGLNVVAMDVAGEQQIDVVSNIVKNRLSLDGKKLGREIDDDTARRKLEEKHGCGPCFPQLSSPPTQLDGKPLGKRCCQSCADVRALYTQLQRGKTDFDGKLVWEDHPVCQHEAVLLEPALLAKIHEGCNLFGFLEVNKVAGNFHVALLNYNHRALNYNHRALNYNQVAGNFHVAPGKAFQSAQGQLVHEFKPFDTHSYNISHEIHSLSYGVHYPNRVNPLDGAKATLVNGSGVFQYFVKVVPTTYHFAGEKKSLASCQYSVTDQFKSAHDPSKGFVLPGVFFIYDISPIMVKFTEKRVSFTYFLTSLCAIVGGVFTVAGILDKLIYSGVGVKKRGSSGIFGS